MFPVFHKKTFVACRKLLRKVERGSTLGNKFWLCCSCFIKLTTCHAANLLALITHQPISALLFFNPQQMFLFFCCGLSWSRKVKNAKHRPKLTTKECCRHNLKVFVSRISPPIHIAGFHMTSQKFKLQNYWSFWYFVLMMYMSSWN